jgi:hypothetical protein
LTLGEFCIDHEVTEPLLAEDLLSKRLKKGSPQSGKGTSNGAASTAGAATGFVAAPTAASVPVEDL